MQKNMQIIFTCTLAFQCFRRHCKVRHEKNWNFPYSNISTSIKCTLLVFVYGMELINEKKRSTQIANSMQKKNSLFLGQIQHFLTKVLQLKNFQNIFAHSKRE